MNRHNLLEQRATHHFVSGVKEITQLRSIEHYSVEYRLFSYCKPQRRRTRESGAMREKPTVDVTWRP